MADPDREAESAARERAGERAGERADERGSTIGQDLQYPVIDPVELARRGEPDADLGAAGGGASGPGNSDPNWVGDTTGGRMAPGRPGGVTHIEPPGGNTPDR